MKKTKKLRVDKDTIRNLTATAISDAKGGDGPPPPPPTGHSCGGCEPCSSTIIA